MAPTKYRGSNKPFHKIQAYILQNETFNHFAKRSDSLLSSSIIKQCEFRKRRSC